MVLVGQDKSNNPATLEYTQAYMDEFYPGTETVTVVADPNWDTVRKGITHPGFVNFPFMAVLDAQMNLLYFGNDKAMVEELIATKAP